MKGTTSARPSGQIKFALPVLLAASLLLGCGATEPAGITEPEGTITIRPAQTVYSVADTTRFLESEATLINGLSEPYRVYPDCGENYGALDKWIDGEWVNIGANADFAILPSCPARAVAPGDSASLHFYIPLKRVIGRPSNTDWFESPADVPGLYRAVFSFCQGTPGRCPIRESEPFELRLVPTGG